MASSIEAAALISVSILFTILFPFTKVEESFNIQSIHDFIYIGFPKFLSNIEHFLTSKPLSNLDKFNHNWSRWDYQDFPGPVPRTFIGSFIIAVFVYPFSLIFNDKLLVQLVSRITIAILVNLSFILYANSVEKFLNYLVKRILILLTLTQFHFIYYCSRPLPNTFALALVLVALSKWLNQNWNWFIAVVALTVIIFRSETVLLFCFILIIEIFVTKRLSILRLLLIGIPFGLLSLCGTVLFDSFFWEKWTWPEGYSLYFNLYLNKSHEWGTQPFFWYFYSAISRALWFSLLFIPFCDKKCFKSLGLVAFLFIFSYSFLEHKELRFIIYVVPMLNTCAADTIANILKKSNLCHKLKSDDKAIEEKKVKKTKEENLIKLTKKLRLRNKSKSIKNLQDDESLSTLIEKPTTKKNKNLDDKSTTYVSLLVLMIVFHLLANLALSFLACLASSQNYPGGEAMVWLNHYIKNKQTFVHVSNLAAQTGFTKFLETFNVTYDKSLHFKSISHQLESKYKEKYFVLEKIDQEFIQTHCSLNSIHFSEFDDHLTCNLTKFSQNCKIIKVVNGLINFHLTLKINEIIQNAPILWIFECF